LEDVGTVRVDEQNACYEIFTPKLRIRVNKAPFSLQIFDKYQKLLFSDYADKGHISDGERKVEYKTLRRDEHFFGLGEKTGEANLIRCGTVINLVTALWKIPCTRVSLSL
jgi:alpha-glucosidase